MSGPTTRQVLERVLDAEALSAMVGAPVRAGHLRIKPGVSLTLSLRDRADGAAVGWARLLWPPAHVKAANNQKRARRLGRSTRVIPLDGEVLLEHGELLTDPRLGRVLAQAGAEGILDPWTPTAVLRHNPLRRLVVAQGQRVVKVWAQARPRARAWHRFLGGALAVPEEIGGAPVSPELRGHVSVQRRVGDTDLARDPDAAATRAVGGMLAALHALGPRLPESLAEHLGAAPPAPARLARVHAGVLTSLDPGLAERLRVLARRLPERAEAAPPVLCHADASPDQVLLDRGTGRVWLTDFDRLCLAPAATDLGSYLVEAGREIGEELLAGYAEHGGRLPSPPVLERAALASRLARLVDPLRRAEPAWRGHVSASLGLLEEAPWTP